MTWASRISLEVIVTAVNLAGADIATVTLAGDVAALDIKRGRARGGERMSVGTCHVGLIMPASDGDWSMHSGSGDALWLGSRLEVRARVDAGTWRDLYAGIVRAMADTFELDGRLRIDIWGVDRLAILAAATMTDAELAGAPQQVAGYISTINLAATFGVGGDEDLIDGDIVTVQHPSGVSRNGLDEAMLAAESENGELWAGRSPSTALSYRDRGVLEAAARWMTDQLAWSNTTLTTSVWDTATWDSGVWSTPGTQVGTTTFSTETDTDEIVTSVNLQRVGGSLIAYESASIYGRRSYDRTDLIATSDDPLRARALWLLNQLAERTARIGALTTVLDPAWTAAKLDALLNIELHDRQRVVWDDGSAQPTIDIGGHVQGVTITVTPATWKVAVALWHYTGES